MTADTQPPALQRVALIVAGKEEGVPVTSHRQLVMVTLKSYACNTAELITA